jgi:hypothetical protein
MKKHSVVLASLCVSLTCIFIEARNQYKVVSSSGSEFALGAELMSYSYSSTSLCIRSIFPMTDPQGIFGERRILLVRLI